MHIEPHVCPMERAGHLDTWWRRLLQNPRRILAPHVSPAMTCLDIGCGPGFFTRELARLVGPQGRVIAVDLQRGMLDLLARTIRGTGIEERIQLHQCSADSLGVEVTADFALAFYVAHEMPDPGRFFAEVAERLSPGGRLLLTDPKFHVSAKEFARSRELAQAAGLRETRRPKIMLSHAVVLTKI